MSGEEELYDLLNDPFEIDNVAGLPDYAGILEGLAEQTQNMSRSPPG
jgi:hypothetical protein